MSSRVNIAGNAFNNCQRLTTITCQTTEPPYITANTFSVIGTAVPAGTPKTLNVPASATGYDTGYWQTTVINQGYTLNATL